MRTPAKTTTAIAAALLFAACAVAHPEPAPPTIDSSPGQPPDAVVPAPQATPPPPTASAKTPPTTPEGPPPEEPPAQPTPPPTVPPPATPPPQVPPPTTPPPVPPDQPPPTTPPPSGTPAIRYIGRFDFREANRPLAAWPGTRIIAQFEGTRVSAQLEESVLEWQEGGPSEIDVAVDGRWTEYGLALGTHSYTFAQNLGPGTHRVEIYRKTEAQNGTTRFLGFDFGPGGKLQAPPERMSRRIEIIGDSATSGFGVEGVGLGPDCPGVDHGAVYQNFRWSWGAKLGETFNAEIHGTTYSGKGVLRNVWRPDTLTMPRIYGRTNPLDATSTYDFAWVPHAIIVMLGGIDFGPGRPEQDAFLSPAEFEAALDAFVDVFRDHAPSAHVILALSPTTPDKLDEGRPARTATRTSMLNIRDRRNNAGDARVHFVEPTRAEAEDIRGCNGHPTPEFHARIAREIGVKVREALGW